MVVRIRVLRGTKGSDEGGAEESWECAYFVILPDRGIAGNNEGTSTRVVAFGEARARTVLHIYRI